jgi:CRP-like cAMP-binding protein
MDDRKILLQQVSFCVGLPEVAITALAAIAVPLQRRAGAIIQIEGEPAEAMYVVTQGRVKVVRIGAQGREQVLLIATAGHHFNSVPMFDGGPCPANAEALTDVSLLALPRVPLNRVVEEHPQLALAFLKEFTSRLRHVVNLVDELALHTVQGASRTFC